MRRWLLALVLAATGVSLAPSADAVTTPTLHWTRCAATFQCASLPVPLDPAKPAGRTISIALIRLPATDRAHRIGSLLINPGGPGASGVDWVRDEATAVISKQVRARFDLIGFDPRGVGRSHPVSCVSDHTLDVLFHTDPTPLTQAARDAYTSRARAFTASCAKKDASLLAHVGTVEAAGDLDRIRRALHERTISYLGFSYGTYLGAEWTDLYPGTVRAAVLDGALDPALSLDEFVGDQAVAFDKELTRFFDWCDASSACQYRSPGHPSAQRYDALAAAVHAKALPGLGSRPLAFGELQYGVGYGMYARYLWPQLGEALAAAADGDGGPLLGMSDQYLDRSTRGTYDNSFEANTAINCLDHSGPRTEQGWYDDAQRAAAKAPRLGFAIVYTTQVCATWPVKARPARVPHGKGNPPAVVIGGTHDPATPYAWSVALHKDLKGSRLITRARDGAGDGHTSYGPASPCVTRLVDAYLLRKALPPAGATC